MLGASEVTRDADFGYYQTPTSGYAIIGDTVWYDDNSDGIQQPGEPGIPNIQVCATPTGGGASICDTTDSNGHYLIEVPAGSYSVAPINPPANYTATTPVPHLLTVQIGEQYLDADFGYDDKNGPLLGTIGDLVFLDANKDGVCNSGDSALSGVSVDLIRDSNANNAWDAGEPIIATVTTVGGTACSAGNYLFSGVPGGRYLVHVSDTNAVLFDYTKSPLGAAGVNNNNQADPYAINLAPGGSNTTADFGYYPLDRSNIGVIGNQGLDRRGLQRPVRRQRQRCRSGGRDGAVAQEQRGHRHDDDRRQRRLRLRQSARRHVPGARQRQLRRAGGLRGDAARAEPGPGQQQPGAGLPGGAAAGRLQPDGRLWLHQARRHRRLRLVRQGLRRHRGCGRAGYPERDRRALPRR
ncbi:SdrD B-like domain-containing protein [Candidatus Amarolinea dominans]|uniref:SdrD B-like domain-containing protein n=1 Tax=Candidatus Amarolinea dominans TaxID=3140696 RepID=UPI00313650B5|nr:hypothetical protein [Anaerolineae bacterium]